MDALRPTRSVTIPLTDVTVRTSRSSGPGGQHANTANTRATVTFDVASSPSLSDTQRAGFVAQVQQEFEKRNKSLVLIGASANVKHLLEIVSLDRVVAIKVLPRKFTSNPQFIERFYAEDLHLRAVAHG